VIAGAELHEMMFAKISKAMQLGVKADHMIQHCSEMSPEVDRLQGLVDRINAEIFEFCIRVERGAPYTDAVEVRAVMDVEIKPVIAAMVALLDQIEANRAARGGKP
jgi:hypothetical protein